MNTNISEAIANELLQPIEVSSLALRRKGVARAIISSGLLTVIPTEKLATKVGLDSAVFVRLDHGRMIIEADLGSGDLEEVDDLRDPESKEFQRYCEQPWFAIEAATKLLDEERNDHRWHVRSTVGGW